MRKLKNHKKGQVNLIVRLTLELSKQFIVTELVILLISILLNVLRRLTKKLDSTGSVPDVKRRERMHDEGDAATKLTLDAVVTNRYLQPTRVTRKGCRLWS